MSNNKFRKIAVPAMAASASVLAVAPAVSAQDVSFTDIDESYTHYDNIMTLAEQGVISGYPDGEFKPYESITRGQVAVMLANALELETPEDVGEVLEAYNDVDENSDYAEAIAAVTEAGVFQGSDGEFDEWGNITREQMATVLVEGFNLNDIEPEQEAELNRDHISDSHVENVQTLANLGITNQLNDFQAYNDIRRDQFSTFVVLTQNVVAENEAPAVESATAVDADTVEVQFEGQEEAVEVELDEELEDGATTVSFEYDGHTYEEVELSEEFVLQPAVESVSAVTPSEVKVNFNKPIEDVTEDDLEVVDTESGAKQYVSSVSSSDDNESVTVEFYDNLESESTYEFTFDLGEEQTVSYQYDFELGTVQNVEFEDQAVLAGQAEGDTPTQLDYKLYDANGVDITEENSEDVTFESPYSDITENGEVLNMDAGTTTTVTAVYTGENGQKVESDEITVTAEAAEPVELSNWTVAESQSVDFTDEDYEQDTEAYSDDTPDYLNVELKDQFGDVYSSDNVTFESLDDSVAVVDKNSGEIQAFETGSLPVKVSVNEDDEEVFSQTVEVDVKAEKVASDIELEQNSVTLSTQDDVGVDVDATVLDQYGNEFESAITADVGDSELTANYNSGNLNVQAGDAEEGTYTVELSTGEDVVEELTVTVEQPGEFAEYEVRGLEDTIDLNSDDLTANLSVVAVDENGLYIEEETENLNVTVKNEDGEEVSDEVVEGTTINAGELSTGDYTVEVTLDNKVIKTSEFSVVDTTELPEVSFTSSNLEVAADGDLLDEITENVDISDEDASIEGVSFVSANDDVVNDEDYTLSAGETSIYVESFEVDVDGDPSTTDDVETIEFDNPEKINVNVTE
ncbi:S-layer homology domain-containing protein [Lentibacillus persicus]|uniref:S-layer homology domain-containing protein n=1 Tax=Lentibacillus persicus TaxID=640948 RepID=A0A1I1VUB5_9BACI|nr:S-layer homology domain-containing protein [Lentibacillus persicus]SFD86511.1 S-layer homology domain-containing protein [Lentibacillus persicus]